MKANKKQIRLHFARAGQTYDRQAGLQRRVANRLLDELETVLDTDPESVLEIGCCTGILTRKLVSRFSAMTCLHVNDLVPDFQELLPDPPPDVRFAFLAGDIETIDLPGQYNLVISSSTFHWLHDLAGFFDRLRAHLLPGGLLAFAMYGPDNLEEIRELTGRGLSYPDSDAVAAMLGPRFDLLIARESREVLFFDDPFMVLRHLRETGVNALTDSGWSRKQLQDFLARYRKRFGDNRGVRLSYHPMYFLARSR